MFDASAREIEQQLQKVQAAFFAKDSEAAALEMQSLVTLWQLYFGYSHGVQDATCGFDRLWDGPKTNPE